MEEWRAVPGYEGLYEVSNMGRIKQMGTNPYTRPPNVEKIRHLRPACHGYIVINLENGCSSKVIGIHRLVASAFLGDIPQGLVIDHVDGNKANNCAWNLEIVTSAENVRRAWLLGLNVSRPAFDKRKILDFIHHRGVVEGPEIVVQFPERKPSLLYSYLKALVDDGYLCKGYKIKENYVASAFVDQGAGL